MLRRRDVKAPSVENRPNEEGRSDPDFHNLDNHIKTMCLTMMNCVITTSYSKVLILRG